MRLRRYSAILLLVGGLPLVQAFDLTNTVHCPEGAVPADHTLSVVYGEEWLPEPLQSQVYGVPAASSLVKGCLSVMSIGLQPEGETLRAPVTLTFECEDAAGRAVPYAYLDGQWQPVSSGQDHQNRVTITVQELTTYILVPLPVS